MLLSGFAAARLIEIVTNRRRHARWRWNYIDECMFVQLTRPPLLLYVCTPGHGFWKSCVWRCDHFRLLGIWFYSRWRITAYILSPISSLIKNSIYFFFLFFVIELVHTRSVYFYVIKLSLAIWWIIFARIEDLNWFKSSYKCQPRWYFVGISRAQLSSTTRVSRIRLMRILNYHISRFARCLSYRLISPKNSRETGLVERKLNNAIHE